MSREAKRNLMLALCVLVALPAFARLRETLKQCNRRYGKPAVQEMRGGWQAFFYRRSKHHIIITFSRGRAVEVYYTTAGGLSDREIRGFLRENVNRSQWVEVDQVAEWKQAHQGEETDELRQAELARELAVYERWRRADGRAEAVYDRLASTLIIFDVEHVASERTKAKKKAEEPPGS